MVLTRMFGAWRATADEATVLCYAEALAPLDLDVAMMAVGHLTRTEDRLPSIARLLEAYRAESRRIALATPALRPGRAPNWQQVNLAGLGRCREALQAAPLPPGVRPATEVEPELEPAR
jgi:hypothetical protein